MNADNKSFLALCGEAKIQNEKAAAIAAAAGLELDTEISEKDFKATIKKFGSTLEERLEKAKVPRSDWDEIASKNDVGLTTLVSGKAFGGILNAYRKTSKSKSNTSQPTEATKTPRWEVRHLLKYRGKYYRPGTRLELDLEKSELADLEESGAIRKVR